MEAELLHRFRCPARRSFQVNYAGREMLRKVEGVYFGPESASWQAVTDAFGGAIQTVDGVGQMAAITIEASELGTFLDPKNREMIDVLNRLWDGREVPWQRRIRSE